MLGGVLGTVLGTVLDTVLVRPARSEQPKAKLERATILMFNYLWDLGLDFMGDILLIVYCSFARHSAAVLQC